MSTSTTTSVYDPVVERRLAQAANRWRWLRFARLSATFGIVVLTLVLLVGAGRVLGLVPPALVVMTLVAAPVLASLALFVAGLAIGVSREERAALAREWERVHEPLHDRLNTLVFLEREKETPVTQAFGARIKQQARALMVRSDRLPVPFPARQARERGLVFLLLLLATILFYGRYKLWELPPVVYQPPPPAAPAEVPLTVPPPESVVEDEAPWGEVRITQPGVDLAVTPGEDVPLQIEAATNRPLKSVAWATAVNGGPDQEHELPPPEEPRFAAYQPTIRPDELDLKEWDVVTYFARATTQDGATYRSEVYFVEVRPFRDDLLRLTQGDRSPLYDLMNDLTGAIEQQQEVIRRTHRAEATRDGRPTLAEPDRAALAQAEDDLSRAVHHLAARLGAAAEKPVTAEPIARLGEARQALQQGADRLRSDAVADAQRAEREALARLVAARKQVQQAAADHPGAFPNPPNDKIAAPQDQLARIAELRDERRVAREFVQQTLQEQRKLNRAARTAPQTANELARREEALGKSLEGFRKQFPEALKEAEKPCAGACQAMSQAAQALRKRPSTAGPALKQAAEKLQALDQALQNEQNDQQLADAYKLKEMLDQEIGQLARVEQDPAAVPENQVKQALAQARETVRQLKDVAEKAPTRSEFGEPLRQALSPPSQEAFEKQCDGLGQCLGGGSNPKGGQGQGGGQGPSRTREAAGAVKRSLEQMARAFEQSQPGGPARGNALQPQGQPALDRGLARLERLAQRDAGASDRPARGESRRQKTEAIADIEAGLASRQGHNDHSAAVVDRLKRDLLDHDEPIDATLLARLRDDLLQRRVEARSRDEKRPDDPKATHLDPARLPPAYRKAIETYFEKLSEQR